MSTNSIRDIALVGTSTFALVLLYRWLFLAGLVEGIRKSHKSAIQQIRLDYSTAYRERVNKVLDVCVDSGMNGDSLKAVKDITDGPLN
nr:MAG TPA: hypothetical protein [Caudoviricetes sp.]DAY44718.1 MAG TPA: hypothetical protein [Caudoviricetes sp.]